MSEPLSPDEVESRRLQEHADKILKFVDEINKHLLSDLGCYPISIPSWVNSFVRTRIMNLFESKGWKVRYHQSQDQRDEDTLAFVRLENSQNIRDNVPYYKWLP